MVKFLSEITGKCKINKMTPGNLGIVLGPTLLRQSGSAAASELVNTDKVIKVISILVENYNEIFPVDISWSQYDDDMNDIIAKVRNMYTAVRNFQDYFCHLDLYVKSILENLEAL